MSELLETAETLPCCAIDNVFDSDDESASWSTVYSFRRALNPVMSKQQNNRACFSELLPSSIPNPSHMNMRNSLVGRALGDSICVMCWSRW